MKKVLLSILGALLFMTIALVSAYSFALVGNLDYNKTLLFDTLDSLENDKFSAFDLKTNDGNYKNWDSYTKIYNGDFLYYSSVVRTSAESFEFVSNNASIDITLSDVANYNTDASNNSSFLRLDKDRTTFDENSIMLRNIVATKLGVTIGDHVTFRDEQNVEYDFVVSSTYSSSVTSINTFYSEVNEYTCFIGKSIFDKIVGKYNGFLIVKKTDKDYNNSFWNEITPLLHDNNIELSLNDKYSVNDFQIKGRPAKDYQDALKASYAETKKDYKNVIIKCLLVVCFLTGLVGTIMCFADIFGFDKFNKARPYLMLVLVTLITGIGVLISKFGPVLLKKTIANSLLYYSFVTPLQFLTGAAIILIVGSIIYAASRAHYNDFITEYKESTKQLTKDDAVNSEGQLEELKAEQAIRDGKKVLFFGSFVAPIGSAGTIRVMNYAKCLANNGVNVYLSTLSNDILPGTINEYGKNIFLLPYAKAPRNKLEKCHLYLNPTNEVKKVLKMFDTNVPETIVVYSVFPIPALIAIRRFCKKNKVRLVFDVVESHSLSTQTFSSFFATYLPNKIQNNIVIKRDDNVICISSYLSKKFKEKDCNTITIPFINDVKNINYIDKPKLSERVLDDSLYVLYVGNPAHGKDSLAPIINAISSRNDNKVVLMIAGSTVEQMIKNEKISRQSLLMSADRSMFLGKVDRPQIEYLYSVCDYSILIRNPELESSKAGFPTKVSESLAHGVPVITNITSDLGSYLDSSNSILVDNTDIKSINNAFDEALNMSTNLREHARGIALEKLDIKSFERDIVDFILKS